MGAGIAASPHCAERRICRCSQPWPRGPFSILAHQLRRRIPSSSSEPGGLFIRQCSAALLGIISLCVPLCPSRIRRHVPNRVALEKIISSGASPGWPWLDPKVSPSPAGGDRFSGTLPPLLAVAGLPERLGPLPRSRIDTDSLSRVAQSEKCGDMPVDNGDIGNNSRNSPNSPIRLPFRSRRPTSEPCPNLPSFPPIHPTSPA